MARSDNDFGWSFFTEDEMKAQEKALAEKLQVTTATKTAADQRLDQMRSMIMPFLNNLKANPEKSWMYWPDRAPKVEAFIEKLNKI